MKKYDIRFNSKTKQWELKEVATGKVILKAHLKAQLIVRASNWANKQFKTKKNSATLRVCSKAGNYLTEWTYPGVADPKKYKG